MEGDMNGEAESRPRIVVGVDGSESSREALRWAAGQAKLSGAELDAVTTWKLPTEWAVPYPEGLDPEADASKVLEETVRAVLGEHPDVEVHTRVFEGHPAPSLVDVARGAQLLVVGSHGHGAFTGMLLGSVSEHCVSHSPCPVVVVRYAHAPS
jgi:nucleotide-binding universal stress UspA family protein